MQTAVQSLDPAAFLRCEVTAFLRRTQGRETFRVGPSAQFPAGCIVKRTRAPRGMRRWSEPFGRDARRTAGEREHENLVGLAACGVNVPRAITWCAGPDAMGEMCSVVVMEHVEHSHTLRQHLASCAPDERRDWLDRLARLVTRMHTSGWYHRDLYLHHVVARNSDGALVLLDVGRARHDASPRARWLVKDLAALLHSTPDAVTGRERLRFLVRWLDERGIARRSARRRLLRAIEAKQARMAAHVPRDERALGAGA